MKNKRAIQFALAGLVVTLALQIVGYRLDHAVPPVTLENQAIYNWLTLFFSPAAFLLRLGDPDAPIFAGWITFTIVLSSNGLLYAALYGVFQAFRLRLQYKLAHENIPVIAELHPERIVRVSIPNWRPRRA
jgi:hypothetical protein